MRYKAFYISEDTPLEQRLGKTVFDIGKGVITPINADDFHSALTLAHLNEPDGYKLHSVQTDFEDFPELTITNLGGMVPVQGEGTIVGMPFYFRARGQRYTFSVASTPDGDPLEAWGGRDTVGYHVQHPYGDEEFAAGYMELDLAEEFIRECARTYMSRPDAQQPTPQGETTATEADLRAEIKMLEAKRDLWRDRVFELQPERDRYEAVFTREGDDE